VTSQHLEISAGVGSGVDRSGCVMKMASNSRCSRSPSRKTLNIASCIAVRCPQRLQYAVLSRCDLDEQLFLVEAQTWGANARYDLLPRRNRGGDKYLVWRHTDLGPLVQLRHPFGSGVMFGWLRRPAITKNCR
jgi:hypothetical protein